jgi:chorismate mutase/prephenate dehydratase
VQEEKLRELRGKIDTIDKRLVELLNERARLALQVGIAKGGRNIQRPEREAEVLHNVANTNDGPLSKEGVQSIFSKIIEVCRTIQYNK